VFDEKVVKAGCLDDLLGGRDPQRAGPHPDVLLMHVKPPLGLLDYVWVEILDRTGAARCST
jgi:hypothetical protein